ncbi:MAG: dienelactone hydrolase family protein [Gammaproteobacteria bacterium]|nr:dienelactone hydrolase family protein [Gammaproteobacteria bacterium]
MTELLAHVELETNPNPDASVIWLHGLGADGHDFEPIVAQLHLPSDAAIRFIFPHAPSLPVTINNGMVMPAWYDIVEMNIDRKIDDVQLKKSVNAVIDFIHNEISRGIASDRIIIAGFSQGGAVAFETALAFPQKLAGLLALSTYFATKDSIQYHPTNQNLPIAIHHGEFDPIVPMRLGEASFALLSSKGYPVEFKRYPMEHSVCRQQIADIRQWLITTLDIN